MFYRSQIMSITPVKLLLKAFQIKKIVNPLFKSFIHFMLKRRKNLSICHVQFSATNPQNCLVSDGSRGSIILLGFAFYFKEEAYLITETLTDKKLLVPRLYNTDFYKHLSTQISINRATDERFLSQKVCKGVCTILTALTAIPSLKLLCHQCYRLKLCQRRTS